MSIAAKKRSLFNFFRLSRCLSDVSLIKEIHKQNGVRYVHGHGQVEDVPVEGARLSLQCSYERNAIHKYPNKHLRQLEGSD